MNTEEFILYFVMHFCINMDFSQLLFAYILVCLFMVPFKKNGYK